MEYYAGTFEAVYVLLHPFMKAESIDKEQIKPSTYPGRATIVRNRAPVSWAEVAERAKLPSIAAVDVGLRTMILGLKAELSNREYADKIDALVHSNGILPPSEGLDQPRFVIATYLRQTKSSCGRLIGTATFPFYAPLNAISLLSRTPASSRASSARNLRWCIGALKVRSQSQVAARTGALLHKGPLCNDHSHSLQPGRHLAASSLQTVKNASCRFDPS